MVSRGLVVRGCMWMCRLPLFQGGDTGSNPVGAAHHDGASVYVTASGDGQSVADAAADYLGPRMALLENGPKVRRSAILRVRLDGRSLF